MFTGCERSPRHKNDIVNAIIVSMLQTWGQIQALDKINMKIQIQLLFFDVFEIHIQIQL